MHFTIPGNPTQLDELLFDKMNTIEEWFSSQQRNLTQLPFYSSHDIRSCGHKLACVDANAFPAGFNNINREHLPLIATKMREQILAIAPKAQHIALIPELHTRNQGYIQNIETLATLLNEAGFTLSITHPRDDNTSTSHNNLQPCSIQNGELIVRDRSADCILLNNDLSDDLSHTITTLNKPVIPPASLGWFTRTKSTHYEIKKRIDQLFSDAIAIDPFFIGIQYENCPHVNFATAEGLDCIKHHAEVLFTSLQRKYIKHSIPNKPFIVIKSDKGTYGMAVMKIFSLEDLDHINRKTRKQMSKEKNGRIVSEIIIQEGILTNIKNDAGNSTAEACIYHVAEKPVGGFLRTHSEKNQYDNLNKPGAVFEALKPSDTITANWYAHTVASRLSMLALAYEIYNDLH